MPGQMMMGPPQAQLSDEKMKEIDEYADKAIVALEGLTIDDINHVFMAIGKILSARKI